jgi:hypothetical protein
MRTTCLVLLMMSCAVLLEEQAFAMARQQASAVSSPDTPSNHPAASTEDVKPQTKRTSADRQGKWHNPSDEKGAIDHPGPISRPPSNVRTLSGKSGSFYQPAFINRGAVKGGSVQNKDAHNLTPGGVAIGTPSRHRSPNPAIVSGTEKRNNTGAIDGTEISRKP